jgi:hypothetical protein
MVDERRKSERIEAQSAGLRVSDSIDGKEIGTVGNLSAGGMMLIANRELLPEGVLQLRIEALPRAIADDTIALGARVLWSMPAHTPGQFWAGLETIDIDDGAHASLERLLAYLEGLA